MLVSGLASAGELTKYEADKSKQSYSVGYLVGGDFLRQGKDINPETLLKGVQDAMAGNAPLMSRDAMKSTLTDLQKIIAETQKKKMLELAEKNLAKGNAFLAENTKKKDVKTLPSGLQYRVIQEGDGKIPVESDSVTVHYTGRLIDGTAFNSTYKGEKPSTFPVNVAIKGLAESLLMMKEGSKWQLFIPPGLAYNDKRKGSIEPNSTLIFDMELLEVTYAK